MDRKAHWDAVYRDCTPDQVSWYQAQPEPSLRLIRQAVPSTASVLEVGGGASTLVDDLLASGFRLTVLDLSGVALAAARSRLGAAAERVTWIEGDVLEVSLPREGVDLWHDRAVFHFLTDGRDRHRYVQQLRHALSPDGHVVIATFAPDGPSRCSGLAVARYSPEALHSELGAEFHLVTSVRQEHRTPAGGAQAFTYCLFRRDGPSEPPD